MRLVKGDPNNKVVYSDDPVGTAEKWVRQGADALHIVDLDAILTRGSNTNMINAIAESFSIPVQVGGGIRSAEIVRDLLQKVDRVVLGTFAYQDLTSVEELVKEFGSNRIVVAIDQIGGMVMIDGWRKSTGMNVFDAIRKFTQIGIQYFLLTSIDRDGTLAGPDIAILSKACSTKVKVIASGGVSKDKDIIAVERTGAYAVILGKALYDNKISIRDAKKMLK